MYDAANLAPSSEDVSQKPSAGNQPARSRRRSIVGGGGVLGQAETIKEKQVTCCD